MLRKLLFIVCLLLFIPLVSAREILNDTDCVVEAEQVIEGVLLVFCQNLRISGEVNGDVIGVALRSEIDGRVNGNIYLVSGQLDLWGYVAKDLLFGGPVLRVNPPREDDNAALLETVAQQLDGGVKAVTLSATFFEQTNIQDGVLNYGYQLVMEGDVQSEVNFWGSLLVIEGEVNGDVYATVGDPASESSQLETLLLPLNFDMSLQNPGLILSEQGRIAGDLDYSGPERAVIDGEILGAVRYIEPLAIVPTLDEPGTFALYFEQFGREFTTLLVIGLLALVSMNKLLYPPLNTMRTRPFASVAVGMLSFLLSFPIVLIIFVLSLSILGFLRLIGLGSVVLPLGLVLGMVNLGGVSIFYFVAIFLARTLVGLGIGRTLLRLRFNRGELSESPIRYVALLLGVFLLALIVSLPVVGIIFNALALFWGLGAILNEVTTELNRVRDTTPTAAPTWYTPSPAASRERRTLPVSDIPPMITTIEDESSEQIVGSENLPAGFDWSFFED
jgi:hypothetical protein